MPLAKGSRLGAYAILDPLGAGGMGEVYRALDTRLGREVAIKGLSEEFSRDPDRLSRFDREARLLAALNHPSIAAIYGLEEFDGNRVIVMELVPGETLSQILTRGALPLEESLKIACQVAEALDAAHERGIVHRDLKPANIKVTPAGRVKVLDLGLAKAFDAKETGSGSDPSLSPTLVIEGTQPGVVLGTAEFMSPEQARGKPIDKRTDIWSFGCVLFELLSGRRAFTGETASDILATILRSEPPWDLLPATTPPRIRHLLVRCLQKNAADRLRDIGDARIEIEETLAELRAGRSSSSAPFVSLAPAAPAERKRRFGLASAAAAAAALVAVALVGIWLLRESGAPPAARAPTEKYVAVLPFEDLTGQPDGQLLGDAFAETMSSRLAGIEGLHVATPRALSGVSAKNPDLARVAQDTGATLVLRGALQRVSNHYRVTYSLVRAPDGVLVAGGDFTGTEAEMFAIQDRMADSVIAHLDVKKPEAPRRGSPGLAPGAQLTYLKAIGALQHYDAPASVEMAITLLHGLNAQEPYSALVLAALGRAYLNKYEMTRDPEWAEKAITTCELARKLDDRLPEVHTTLGQVLALTGNPGEAIKEFERALADQPSSIDALLGLAGAYRSDGRVDDAETAYRRAIERQPNYWAVYNQLGFFYFRAGRYGDAIPMFRKAVRLRPDSFRSYNNLAASLFKIDRFADARQAYQRSIKIKPNDSAYSGLGILEYYVGNYRAAASAFEQATKLTPTKYLYWANLGDAYRWTPDLKDPTAAYEKAIRLAEGELGLNPNNPLAHATLATCYAKIGKVDAASRHIQRAIELEPANPDHFLYAAIVANIAGKTDEALASIRSAIAAGSGAAQIEREPEFSSLRTHPGFQDAIASAKRLR